MTIDGRIGGTGGTVDLDITLQASCSFLNSGYVASGGQRIKEFPTPNVARLPMARVDAQVGPTVRRSWLETRYWPGKEGRRSLQLCHQKVPSHPVVSPSRPCRHTPKCSFCRGNCYDHAPWSLEGGSRWKLRAFGSSGCWCLCLSLPFFFNSLFLVQSDFSRFYSATWHREYHVRGFQPCYHSRYITERASLSAATTPTSTSPPFGQAHSRRCVSHNGHHSHQILPPICLGYGDCVIRASPTGARASNCIAALTQVVLEVQFMHPVAPLPILLTMPWRQ